MKRSGKPEGPFCPLTSAPCIGERCAWHLWPTGACSIPALADYLERLADNIRE